MDGVVEIITGRERRRQWSTADKLRIVAETHEPGVRVCDVAARHGLCQSLVFAWRRQVREGLLAEPGMPVFMPVQMLEAPAPATQSQPAPARQSASLIEIELGDGRQVRVGRDVNQAALRRVLAALRG
jgi:transposase